MPRSIAAFDVTPQRVTRSQSRVAATTNLLPDVASPPCDSVLLRELNCGNLSHSTPDGNDGCESTSSPVPSHEEFIASLEEDNVSCSSDETWTPSVDGEDSDDEHLDDDGTSWQETPLEYKDFSILFNKVDTDLERGYFEEVKELKKRVLREFDTISSDNAKRKSTLTASEVFNAVYNTDILFSVLTFQNKSLIAKKHKAMDFKEFEVFLRCFFGFCFYGCSLSDVSKHPNYYPLITTSLHELNSRGPEVDSKISRMNCLLRSFDGQAETTSISRTENLEDGVFWSPIYGIDRELEKLFRDVGGRTSDIAFINGYTDLIIDDKKLCMRSTKANYASLSRMKSAKSFGLVGRY